MTAWPHDHADRARTLQRTADLGQRRLDRRGGRGGGRHPRRGAAADGVAGRVPAEPTATAAPAPAPVADTEPAEHEAWRQGPSIDAEDDHFEPGPVQLPPGEDIGYWGSILGLVGGPLLLLWVALASPFHAGWWILGGIALFLGGFGLLVLRQPAHRDPFDDDDGARV